MNKTTMVMETYETPKAEVIEVEVEKGFAVLTSSMRHPN